MDSLTEIRRNFGARIKVARKDAGLTYVEFATAMGRSSRKWSWQVETGQLSLGTEELPRLAKVLRKPIRWLLGEGAEAVPEEEELVTGFRILPQEGQRWLLGSLRGMLDEVGRSR